MIRVMRDGMVEREGVRVSLRSNELIALVRGRRAALIHRRAITPCAIVRALWKVRHR